MRITCIKHLLDANIPIKYPSVMLFWLVYFWYLGLSLTDFIALQPILLILTTDWSEAWNISKVCEKLLYYYRTTHRCKILYGGRGNVQEEMVSLINGCDVLVSTIPSLLGMIDKHCTNLERLCHLVFDRAHILVENFSDEIKVLNLAL